MKDDILIMFYEDYLDEVYGIDARDSLTNVPDWYRQKSRDEAIVDHWTDLMKMEDIEE